MDLSTVGRDMQQLLDENRQLRLRLADFEAAYPASHWVDKRFRTCLDNMLDCFAIFSSMRDASGRIADFRIEYANRAGCQCNGLPLAQYVGRTLLEAVRGHRRCRLFENYCRVVETGEPAELESVEYEDHLGDQGRITRAFDVRVWKLDDGVAVSWRDVTARKQAEEDLHRLTRHTRCSLWKATVTGLPGWDTSQALEGGSKFLRWDGKLVDREAARMVIDLECGPGECYEDVWYRSRLPEDDLRMGRTSLAALQRGEHAYEQQFRCYDRHGQIQWLHESTTIVPLQRGQWQVFGAVINISAQKAVEEALRDSEQRFRKVFEESALGMALVGQDRRLRSVNVRLCQMLGYSEDELTQKTVEQITYPDDLALGAEQARQLMRGEISAFCLEKRYLHRNGQAIWGNLTASIIHDATGRPLYALSTIEDITHRKQVAEELERAKAAAEAANRAKDQFIAVLSHELRTPLTPAVAILSMLEGDGRLPADVRDDLTTVRHNLSLEVRLIADLLDISRVMSGKLHVDRRPTDVAEAIRDAVRIVRGDVDAKGQSLTVEIAGAPYFVLGDSARLQQVFWNLLRNATKFTMQGGTIVIRAALAAGDERANARGNPRGGEVVIAVTDSGRGIAPQLLPRLFRAFEQAQDARDLGGLGLGLAICKAVVEMHGGSITASSEGAGKGATFTVRLPLLREQAQKTQACTAPQIPRAAVSSIVRPVRILLVEDNRDTAVAMSRLLRLRGHEVRMADSVSAALQAVADQVPDLLISDIGLPDGSGLELMRQIGAARAALPSLPAIAFSGYGQEQDIRQSREAGFALHLTKPIEAVRLYEAIAMALTPSSASP